MSDNKITDYMSLSKSNHKILKFITIILSILIVICLFFLIIGFINKFGELEKKGKTISKNIKSAVEKADLIIIHTEWNDFKSINFKNLLKNKKAIIFDMRNIYSPLKMKQQGLKYFGVGR